MIERPARHTPADVRLEPLTEAHLEDLAVLIEDPAVQRFTRIPLPTPPDFPRRYLETYEEGRRKGIQDVFAVVDVETGEFLGIGVAPRIDADGRTLELGYVVVPGARGRGIATRTLQLLTDWAFETLGALRLELIISVENHASKRVAEHCGYRREGILRSYHFKQGRREDIELWSRLPTDP